MKKQTPVIGLISAVPFESARLLRALKYKTKISPIITSGAIENVTVIHITSGIGMANAAHAATVLIRDYKPEFILHFGIGGAYPGSGLGIGDLAAAEKEVYADTGVITKDGYKGMEEIGIPLIKKDAKKYYNEFPLDPSLLKRLDGIRRGVFLTVSQATGTLKRARALRNKYDALCENMEGAAVAQICRLYDIPLVEIRGISNMVGDRDKSKWDIAKASDNCQRAVIDYLRRL